MGKQSMMWKSSNIDLDQYEKQVDRIIGKLEKANSLGDELAKKDHDVSVESLVYQLYGNNSKLDEFEIARILTPLFRCNGEVIMKMISAYLRG